MQSLLVCGSAFCFFSWCKLTIEQIYCNLSVNLCFPTEWGRGQQNSIGMLETGFLHMQHPGSQKQKSISRNGTRNHTKAIQPTNQQSIRRETAWKQIITRNLLTDGQIYTPRTAALLWHYVFILLHFEAAVQGCWVLALSKWNRDDVVPYVRQLNKDSWPDKFAMLVHREH